MQQLCFTLASPKLPVTLVTLITHMPVIRRSHEAACIEQALTFTLPNVTIVIRVFIFGQRAKCNNSSVKTKNRQGASATKVSNVRYIGIEVTFLCIYLCLQSKACVFTMIKQRLNTCNFSFLFFYFLTVCEHFY